MPNPTTAHYCDALYRAETAEARVARLEAEVERLLERVTCLGNRLFIELLVQGVHRADARKVVAEISEGNE